MTTREVTGDPGGLPMLLKAALPSIPGVNALPGVRKTGRDLPDLTLRRIGVEVDARHAGRYAEVCGFAAASDGRVPLPYLHVLAFPLHMQVMSDPAFPFPAIGTVHLENVITRHRPVVPGERVDVTVTVERLRPHRQGRAFDFVTTIHAGSELVWESTSTYLRLGGGDADAPGGTAYDDVPAGPARWKLPSDLGRRYAAVSGDHNPIHLYPLTAKALGFPRQIAHGMWSKARCVAALDNRIPDAATVGVAFKKPILLPGTVGFGAQHASTEGGWDFSLRRPKDGAPHLLGSVRPL